MAVSVEVARLYALVGADDSELTRKLAAADVALEKFAAGAATPAKISVDTFAAGQDLDAVKAKIDAVAAPTTIGLDAGPAGDSLLSMRDKAQLAFGDIKDKADLAFMDIKDKVGNAGDTIRVKMGNAADGVRQKFAQASSEITRDLGSIGKQIGRGLLLGVVVTGVEAAVQGLQSIQSEYEKLQKIIHDPDLSPHEKEVALAGGIKEAGLQFDVFGLKVKTTLDQALPGFGNLVDALLPVPHTVDDINDAARTALPQLQAIADQFARIRGTVIETSPGVLRLKGDMDSARESMSEGTAAAQKYTSAFDTSRESMKEASVAAQQLGDDLNRLPNEIGINVKLNISESDRGLTKILGVGGSESDRGLTGQPGVPRGPRQSFEPIVTGHAQATKATDDHASAVRQKLADAYDELQRKAHAALDRIHQDNVRAIDDARDQKNAVLDAAETEIRAKLSAAEAGVQALRDARRERELRDAVASAPDDQSKAAAVQELNDFLADQRLARLRSKADEQIGEIEAQKKLNDDKAAADKAAEDRRYSAKVDALAAESRLVAKYLRDETDQYEKAFAKIAALAAKYGLAGLLGIKPSKAADTDNSKRGTPIASSDGLTSGGRRMLAEGMGGGAPLNINLTATLVLPDGRVLADLVVQEMHTQGSLRTPNRPSTGMRR